MCFVIHWHESAMDLHVFPFPIPPPASLSTRSLWVFPVHQARALVSCIQPGLVICFTLDNVHVSMLFSRNIPPSPSPTEPKSLFCTSVSLFLFCTWGYLYHQVLFHSEQSIVSRFLTQDQRKKKGKRYFFLICHFISVKESISLKEKFVNDKFNLLLSASDAGGNVSYVCVCVCVCVFEK